MWRTTPPERTAYQVRGQVEVSAFHLTGYSLGDLYHTLVGPNTHAMIYHHGTLLILHHIDGMRLRELADATGQSERVKIGIASACSICSEVIPS